MTQDMQPMVLEPTKEQENIPQKSAKMIYFISFFLGIILTLGAAFLIGTTFPSKESGPQTDPELVQQIEQIKDELRFIRDRYGSYVEQNQKKDDKNKDIEDISVKMNDLTAEFQQFKLGLKQTSEEGNSLAELLDHLSKLRQENEGIHATQELLIGFLTLKEIKSKINKGQIYEDEFKILRDTKLPLDALLQELLVRLPDSYPTIQDLRSQYKNIWMQSQQPITETKENFFVKHLGNWVRITKTQDANYQKASVKDDFYREAIASMDAQNISQAIEIVQGLPKEKLKFFDNWTKQAQLYLEGQNLQDHIDHWLKVAFKKIVTESLKN